MSEGNCPVCGIGTILYDGDVYCSNEACSNRPSPTSDAPESPEAEAGALGNSEPDYAEALAEAAEGVLTNLREEVNYSGSRRFRIRGTKLEALHAALTDYREKGGGA